MSKEQLPEEVLPEEVWVGEVDNFSGTRFITGKSATVTVMGHNGLKGNDKKHYIHCSVCSVDEELYPKGSLMSRRQNLNRGKFPCGCGQPQHSDRQSIIEIQRILKDTNPLLSAVKVHKDSSGVKVFTLHCDRCSADNELWPEGSITASKYQLKVKTLPCGCSRNPQYSDRQAVILVSRKCEDLGYSFLGFSEDYKGTHTKLSIYNPVTNNTWHTTTINNLLSNDVRDPRLSGSEKIPQDVRERQLTEVLYSEGSEFISWVSGYKNTSSYFKWKCNNGHLCSTKSVTFLKDNVRCPRCARHGYNPNKEGTLYLVEWYGFGESYLKKGVTNRDTLTRIIQQYKKGKLDYKILREVSGDGKIIQDAEEFLNSKMEGYACPKDWLPDGYTETEHNTPENYKFLMEYFDELEDKITNL